MDRRSLGRSALPLLFACAAVSLRGQEQSRPAALLDGVRWVRGSAPPGGRPVLVTLVAAGAKEAVEAAERAAVLQARFGSRGAGVALVFEEPEKTGFDAAQIVPWSDVAIGVVARRAPRKEAMVALAADGSVCWRGQLSVDAELVLDELLEGTFAARYWQVRDERAADLGQALREGDAAKLHEIANALLAIRTTTAEPWFLALLATTVLDRDQEAAFELANRATHALTKSPRELHKLVLAGLLEADAGAESRLPGVALQALNLAARQPAATLELRVDLVAALLACGRAERAQELGRKLEAEVAAEPALAARLSLVLGLRKPVGPSEKMVVLEQQAESVVAHLIKTFNRLNREHDDPPAAELVGRILVCAWATEYSTLNNFGWRLVTEPEVKDRYLKLAVFTGEAMARCPGWEQPPELDTLALELFEYGLVETAIGRQKEAMKTGSKGSDGGYPVRLERYEHARAARTKAVRPAR